MEPTGYSAPVSADTSMNNSGTSSSSINTNFPPKKIQRGAEQAPAAPARAATMENIAEHGNAPMVVLSTSSSELHSIASSQDYDRRVALAKAMRGTTKAAFSYHKRKHLCKLSLQTPTKKWPRPNSANVEQPQKRARLDGSQTYTAKVETRPTRDKYRAQNRASNPRLR